MAPEDPFYLLSTIFFTTSDLDIGDAFFKGKLNVEDDVEDNDEDDNNDGTSETMYATAAELYPQVEG